MDRDLWMTVRAYMPTILALALAFALAWLLSGWRQNPYLAGLFGTVRWAPLLALGFAVVHGSWITYRLWRADRGEGLLRDCGGLLGGEIDGRYGPYRRCFRCSRIVPQREYASLE